MFLGPKNATVLNVSENVAKRKVSRQPPQPLFIAISVSL